jgi:choice-of-anchor B domain-containing protein
VKASAWPFMFALTGFLAAAGPTFADRGDITLMGQKYLGGPVTEVWGYKHPTNGRYYALIGSNVQQKLFIVDVTAPDNPILVSQLGPFPVYDVTAFGNYAYICDGGSFFDLQSAPVYTSRIVDLSDPASPVFVTQSGNPLVFRRGHSVNVTQEGYMFLSAYGGMIGYDLTLDPLAQTEQPYQLAPGLVGHDAIDHENKLYDFSLGNGVDIWDLSTFPVPSLLQTIPHGHRFGTGSNAHSGDTSEDGRYLYVCDEGTIFTTDIYVWDTQSPSTPVGFVTDPDATVHNLYVDGDLAFTSFYAAGFRVYNVKNPTQPQLLDEYDTNSQSSQGLHGAWGVYPFDDRGYVYISDMDNGLFVFSVEGYTCPNKAESITALVVRGGNELPMEGNTLLTCPQGDMDVLKIRLDLADVCFGQAIARERLTISPPIQGNMVIYASSPYDWTADSDARPWNGYVATFTKPFMGGCGNDEIAVYLDGVELGRVSISGRSPDLITAGVSSGRVTNHDLSRFSVDYLDPNCQCPNAVCNSCGDYNLNSCMSMADHAIFSFHWNHQFPGLVGKPSMDPDPVPPTGGVELKAALRQNPARASAILDFVLPKEDRTQIRVFDTNGRLVSALVDEILPAGPHMVTWNGRDEAGKRVSSGIYYVTLNHGETPVHRKLIMLSGQ